AASARRGIRGRWSSGRAARRPWAGRSLAGQAAALLVGLERVGELAQVTGEHRLERVRRVLDAVVGHAVLREVVRPHLLRAFAAADLRTALGRLLGTAALQLPLVEARAQDLERALAVLDLRALVLAGDDEAARQVRDTHRRVGRVDRLAARPCRAI